MSEKHLQQARECEPRPTRTYEKPELRDYGDIGSLTQDRGLTSVTTDGGVFAGFTKTA